MATTWISGIGFDDRWTPPAPEAGADELDWSDIFSRYHLSVRAFVRTRVPAAWVDDTVQDTFVRAYRSRHRLDASRPIWPWLVTIAKRACIETCRHHRPEVAFDGSLHSGVAPDDPHLELERRLRAAAVAGALDALPPRHRRLLVRYEVEGQSYTVMANEEAISGQALKSVLCRARESFRVRYEALAKADGLAVLPVVGPLLMRCRGRWQRGHEAMTRMPPEMVGALFAGLTATAWFVGVPTAQRAFSAPVLENVALVGESVGAAPLVVEAPAPVGQAGGAIRPERAEARVNAPQPATPTPLNATLVPSTRGTAGVVTTPDRSTANVLVELSTPAVERWDSLTLTVECGEGLSATACPLIHHVGTGG